MYIAVCMYAISYFQEVGGVLVFYMQADRLGVYWAEKSNCRSADVFSNLPGSLWWCSDQPVCEAQWCAVLSSGLRF